MYEYGHWNWGRDGKEEKERGRGAELNEDYDFMNEGDWDNDRVK
jgi:hypothetical protein